MQSPLKAFPTLIIFAFMLSFAPAGPGLAAGSQGPGVTVKADKFDAWVLFIPGHMRVQLFENEMKPVDLTNSTAILIIKRGQNVVSRNSLQLAETNAALASYQPEEAGAGKHSHPMHKEMNEDKDHASHGSMHGSPASHTKEEGKTARTFLWAPLELGKIPSEGLAAEIEIANISGHSKPITIEVPVKYDFLSGYACPSHHDVIMDQEGKCPEDGKTLHQTRYVYRCPMNYEVASLSKSEKCWKCGMDMEKWTPHAKEEHHHKH